MNITNLKEIFENCCYENNNEKIYYNKSQRKPLTSVTGMNLPKKIKKILDKVIQLMYNILKGMTLPIGRKCMTGVSAMRLRGWVKAYA